jgi:hypothetical protein
MGESILYLQVPTIKEGRRDNKSNIAWSLVRDLLTVLHDGDGSIFTCKSSLYLLTC